VSISNSQAGQQRRVHPYPPRKLSEDEIVARLEMLFEAVEVPLEFRAVVLEILCPDSHEVPPLPESPTKAMPGTLEKLQVMAARAERGECIFHPDDPTWHPVRSDALFQVARNHRNGESARLEQPLLRKAAEGDPEPVEFHDAPRPQRRHQARPRKRPRRQAAPATRYTQRLLF